MRLTHPARLLVALATLTWSVGAQAQDQASAGPSAETPAPAAEEGAEPRAETSKDSSQIEATLEKPETSLPFRNSTFLFDQSVNTQTAHLETSPQLTYVPSYEWWLSFRPRYYFSEKVSLRARFDYYKEFANNSLAGSPYYPTSFREDIFGDIWTDLVYETRVPAITKYTKAAVGLRLRFPTSKESHDEGIYLKTGATVGVRQGIPINGPGAKFFSDAHVTLGAWYDHAFSRATTPTNPDLDQTREDADGRSFVSDQFAGETLVNHRLVTTIDTGIQVTPKLALTADFIFFNSWHYAIPETCVATLTGCASVGTTPGFGTNHTAATWFLASVEYELFDELSLSLGYYSLANALGPDGQQRGLTGHDNIWWSPDARVFFDITANLDDIYELATGRRTSHPEIPNRNTTTEARSRLGPLGI